MKKAISLCLAIVLCLGLAVPALAADRPDTVSDFRSIGPDVRGQMRHTYSNPLYRSEHGGTASAAAVLAPASQNGDAAYTSVAEAAGYVRERLQERAETISFSYATTASIWLQFVFNRLTSEIFDAALAHTGVPTQGDYLQFQYSGWSCSGSYYAKGSTYLLELTYTVSYHASADQERETDAAVEALLEQMELSGKSDYEKVSAIYEFICKNVVYDDAHVSDDSYKLKYSAYAALIDKTAVCQGYAVLLYRLLLESGVDCRVIAGLGDGGPHAWNIVRLNGLYYDLDATWDAERYQHGYPYQYFLRSDANFRGHIRDAEYRGAEFYTAYPMGPEDYDPAKHGMVAGFTDVLTGDYFAEAVAWAYFHDPQITDGMTETSFEPAAAVTREQAVTFLWRSQGKPAPNTAENPFRDVEEGAYYYDAVLWAVENGITDGVEDDAFGVGSSVTRGQMVTFLFRTEGEPGKTGEGAWYADAENWASLKNLLDGTALGYDTYAACPRADVVTYMYRDMAA